MDSAVTADEQRHLPGRGAAPARSATDPYGLLALSRTLFDSTDAREILGLALTHVAVLGPFRAELGLLSNGDEPVGAAGSADAVEARAQLRRLARTDGPLTLPGRPWCWAFGLRGPEGVLGHLAVSSRFPPREQDRFLLSMLVRLTAAALSLAIARRRQSDDARELSRLRSQQAGVLGQLDALRTEIRQQRTVHETLDRVAALGSGEDGLTRALYELTGLPALVEDRFGNLRSWAGPGPPTPYPVPVTARREEMLREVALRAEPVRVKDRLVALARPRGEVLGVLALMDPDGTADALTVFALGQAVRSLSLELMHLRNLAEAELRLHRELVEDLLEGTDEKSAYARSDAVGHDLHRPHYVVVVHCIGRMTDERLTRPVERAAAALGLRPLTMRRGDCMVLLTGTRPDEATLDEALDREFGTHSWSAGVSARCDCPGSIPRCYQEALRALEVRQRSRERDGSTFFDDLGLYRILGPGNDLHELEAFVREWLGSLIDYDKRHGTDMVQTLSEYFDCGGNYDETATALAVHRSTLRYRLQRIREIGGCDLADVDTRLNLQVATRVRKIMLGGQG
ncbi:helix-turn-helix domain-containing protein [Streptacidiphilus sp. ASG 303]|uniref:PucR family transcriptional regulator n=1 Tax=Streptacidiphilus sp. ASG 303 TaxID=2896847 RepID=UPI001E60AF44|nr:helix-turn-helix domain-containing protein [Streptacidiphilus sp. ASG 303]MCD0485512.1 helix-turn-helix domain-containing protein [Streptacidiphilus sp. ASG 303]